MLKSNCILILNLFVFVILTTDPNHTNLIVNVHICCLALLTIVVVKYGCLETNHNCVNIIIELLLCKTWKYQYYFFFYFHVEVKITITSLSLSPMSSNAATEPADTKILH